jgi:uncharacterized membrane protein HdeD (DUF308 family)
MIFIGVMLLLSGLITMVLSNRRKVGAMDAYWSAQGILNLFLGIVFITSPSVMAKIFIILIGIVLLIMGLLQLLGALGTLSRSAWGWFFFVIALITLASGVFLLFDPFKSAEAILPFLGAILVLNGISELINSWKVGRQKQKYKGYEAQDVTYEEV